MTNNSRRAPQPVFVDSTGRRRRLAAILGVAGAALLTLVSAMLVAGFIGGGSGYLPGLPNAPRTEPAVGQPGTPLGNGSPATPGAPAPGRTSPAPATSAGSGSPPVPGGSATPPSNQPASPGHRNTAHPTPSRKK